MTAERPGAAIGPTSLRVVEAVAADREVAPIELEPLYRSIDPDSLDRMFPATGGEEAQTGPNLTFTFADRRVTVTGDGQIDVASTTDGSEPSARPGRGRGEFDATQPTD